MEVKFDMANGRLVVGSSGLLDASIPDIMQGDMAYSLDTETLFGAFEQVQASSIGSLVKPLFQHLQASKENIEFVYRNIHYSRSTSSPYKPERFSKPPKTTTWSACLFLQNIPCSRFSFCPASLTGSLKPSKSNTLLACLSTGCPVFPV